MRYYVIDKSENMFSRAECVVSTLNAMTLQDRYMNMCLVMAYLALSYNVDRGYCHCIVRGRILLWKRNAISTSKRLQYFIAIMQVRCPERI